MRQLHASVNAAEEDLVAAQSPGSRAFVDALGGNTYRTAIERGAPDGVAPITAKDTCMTRRHADKGGTPREAVREPRTKLQPARGKPSRSENSKGGADARDARGSGALDVRLQTLERERDALLAQVAELQQRCRVLEDSQAHVRNRLAWAIDSIESVLQGKG